MLDLHLYQFTYTTDPEQPYYLGVTFNNTEVTVGFVDAEPGDTAAFEVIDKFNGKQLAYINITHLDVVKAWHDIVTKAHHLVLELHAEAVKQAERDRLFSISVDNFFEAFEAADKYSHNIREIRGVTDEQLRQMKRAADSMRVVADALDLVEDPD